MPQQAAGVEVAAGVFAGVMDALLCHPIDRVKTQFHCNASANSGMVVALLSEARGKGGVLGLYRGLLPACLRPQALCMFAGNEYAKRLVAGEGQLSHATAPVAGFLTGYLESVCVTPFEVVKARSRGGWREPSGSGSWGQTHLTAEPCHGVNTV